MLYAAKITEQDGSWIVEFPDKPNINTYGGSLKDALAMAEEALNAAIESELDMGFPLVEPRTEAKGNGMHAIELDPRLEVSYRLFEARRGLTQGTVAKAAGITQQAYQKLESARSNPTVRTLSRVAKAVGKRVEIRFV
jgi:antitoxin HicB